MGGMVYVLDKSETYSTHSVNAFTSMVIFTALTIATLRNTNLKATQIPIVVPTARNFLIPKSKPLYAGLIVVDYKSIKAIKLLHVFSLKRVQIILLENYRTGVSWEIKQNELKDNASDENLKKWFC